MPILDTFTRADENPLAGGWLKPTASPAVQLVGGKIGATSIGGACTAIRQTTVPADFQIFIRLDVLPTQPGAGSNVVRLGAYVSPSLDDTTATGFQVRFRRTSIGGQDIAICKQSTGSNNPISSTNVPTFAAGDSIGLARVGTTWTIWRKIAGVWAAADSVVDATFTGPLYPMVQFLEGDVIVARMDNFGTIFAEDGIVASAGGGGADQYSYPSWGAEMQSRKEIIDDFLAWTTEINDALARDLAERALNRALLAIWMKAPWSQFVRSYPFTSVPGQRDYVMPHYFGRIAERGGRIRNLSTGNWLYPLDRATMNEQDPIAGTRLEVPSTATHYLVDQTTGVTEQPDPAGEELEVLSTDGGDVDIRVVVEGFQISSQYLSRSQVVLTGTGVVPIGSWVHVNRFGKSYAEGVKPSTELTSSRGTVILRTVTGGRWLQALLPDQPGVDLRVLTLYPTPLLPEQYNVPFIQAPRRMIFDADPIPEGWGNALFEEMQMAWHVNKGEFRSDAQAPRPHLADLIATENAMRVPLTKQRGQFR